jgi:hypothetical protein
MCCQDGEEGESFRSGFVMEKDASDRTRQPKIPNRWKVCLYYSGLADTIIHEKQRIRTGTIILPELRKLLMLGACTAVR